MEQRAAPAATTCTVQLENSDEAVIDILKRYSDLYAEVPESIYKYFQLLIENKKPAVSIEIYDRSAQRVEFLKEKLAKFFFVYGTCKSYGDHSSYHLSVSKIKSIARYADMMVNEGFYGNAGAIGLLLGFDMNKVSDYINRTKEDRIKC